jgi:hypothetical protein
METAGSQEHPRLGYYSDVQLLHTNVSRSHTTPGLPEDFIATPDRAIGYKHWHAYVRAHNEAQTPQSKSNKIREYDANNVWEGLVLTLRRIREAKGQLAAHDKAVKDAETDMTPYKVSDRYTVGSSKRRVRFDVEDIRRIAELPLRGAEVKDVSVRQYFQAVVFDTSSVYKTLGIALGNIRLRSNLVQHAKRVEPLVELTPYQINLLVPYVNGLDQWPEPLKPIPL